MSNVEARASAGKRPKRTESKGVFERQGVPQGGKKTVRAGDDFHCCERHEVFFSGSALSDRRCLPRDEENNLPVTVRRSASSWQKGFQMKDNTNLVIVH